MSRGLWLAALAALLYVLGVLAWVRSDRRAAREVFPPGSVFSTGEEGLSLAYAYLRERAPERVAPLHRRVEPGLPETATVLRVQPTRATLLLAGDKEEEEEDREDKEGVEEQDEGEAAAEGEEQRAATGEEPEPGLPAGLRLLSDGEEAWVRGGGRLVLAFADAYGPAVAAELRGRQPVRKVFPLWPGVRRLVPPSPRGLEAPALAGAHAVFLAGDSPMILRQPVGAGEVILLAVPEILHNAYLGQADHLALLESLAGAAQGRTVLFDERSHGLADSGGVLEMLSEWGLGPLLLLALLAAGAAFRRHALRLGPPEREPLEGRSDAVELLDSLADLYDRALGRGDAIRLYHQSFLHTVAVESGLRGRALEERALSLLGGFATPAAGEDLSRERFERALDTINQAFRRLTDAKRK